MPRSSTSAAAQRAGAAVVHAEDPSALWHNPAALVELRGTQLYLGVNVVGSHERYQRAGDYAPLDADRGAAWPGTRHPVVENAAPAQPVPLLALSTWLGEVAVAVGVLAPQGNGGRDYPLTVGDLAAPAPQRYDTAVQRASLVVPSVGAALRLGARFSIGARFGLGFGRFESISVVQAVPNLDEDPAFDSTTRLAVADDFVPAGALAVRWTPSTRLELALAWTSPLVIDASGTSTTVGTGVFEVMPGVESYAEPVVDAEARCAPGGTRAALKACLRFTLPQTVTVGARWVVRDRDGAERGDLELDLRWEDWSAGAEQHVVVDAKDHYYDARVQPIVLRYGLRDTFGVSLGGARRLGRGRRAPIVRAGLSFETAAAPASWTRLGQGGAARYGAAAGVGLPVGARVRLDLGVAALLTRARDVTNVDRQGGQGRQQPDVSVPLYGPDLQPPHPFNAGRYESRYWILSLAGTVTW